MRRFLLFFWILSLVLAACFVSGSKVQAQNQNQYSLALQGFVWNHSTLKVLVVTADNESWWNPDYLNTSLRAIGQWNDALAAFAANYTDFSYLSSLSIDPTVSNQVLPGFDIYVNWTDSPLSNTTDEVGLSQIFSDYANTIVNCSVNLAAHTNHGEPLTDVDMQNVAIHELGHSLGLGHCNYTGDVMYSIYSIGSSSEAVSTLDAYGVATVFAWEPNTTGFYPVDNWLNVSSVMLPANIAYRGLPVLPQNVSPQTLANDPVGHFLIVTFEILIHPEILALVLLVIVAFVIVSLVARRRR